MKLLVSFLAVLFYGLLYYICLPTLSFAYVEGFIFIALALLIVVVLITWWVSDDEEKCVWTGGITLVIMIVIGIVASFLSSDFVNSTALYQQIGKIEEKSFTEDIVEIDTSQIPVVDIPLAKKLADKKLGEDVGLGSQMEVGEFTNKQQVNGKLVYVAPLEYRGFTKWFSNRQGTPGYVIVSATDPNDVKLVKTYGDEKQEIRLKYLSSAFFSSNLERHIRSCGYRTTGLTEYSFELDDTGRPYWVVTTYENTTVWKNPEATGVVICDAQTGECKWYSIKETPEWVDIIQPEEFIKNQLKNYGEYPEGKWFNPSDKGKQSVTKHITTVYNEGHCYYYTGISSVGKDNSTTGFIMVNTRDKSVVKYKMVGATEEAAMRSAEGQVQNMKYSATTPIPLNVSGIPTYFCTLKDKEGLVKQFAMISIKDYGDVANGSSIAETKRAYIKKMNDKGNAVDFGEEAYGYTIEGVVSRISANIEGGDTYYYMILNDDSTKLYLASYTISEELPITREGDTVKISYIDESNGAINIAEFDNMSFSQTVSSKQEQLNKEQQENNIINNPDNSIIEVNPEKNKEELENMTDEEISKLLKNKDK